MKGFTIIPPKQRYMTLAEIYESYGSRGVVAYSCSVVDSIPQGGFVIAVQDRPGIDYSNLKEYQRRLQKKFPDKNPIYYFCLEKGSEYFAYDNGTGNVEVLPAIEIKESEVLEALGNIPEELLAKALTTIIKSDEL